MASRSDAHHRAANSQRHSNAVQVLLREGLAIEAVVLEWIALRGTLFAWLEDQAIDFVGTRDALVAAMKALDPYDVAADLAFIYHVATLAEWDEQFEMTNQQVETVRKACERVRGALQGSFSETNR